MIWKDFVIEIGLGLYGEERDSLVCHLLSCSSVATRVWLIWSATYKNSEEYLFLCTLFSVNILFHCWYFSVCVLTFRYLVYWHSLLLKGQVSGMKVKRFFSFVYWFWGLTQELYMLGHLLPTELQPQPQTFLNTNLGPVLCSFSW